MDTVADWRNVVWAEARQVTSFLGWPSMDGDEAAPARFFHRLRRAGSHEEAVTFLALALPRDLAVRWLRNVALEAYPASADSPTWRSIDAWVRQPADLVRRETFDAALAASAETHGAVPAALMLLGGTAVYFSGGSLAPLGATAMPPTKQDAGHFVSEGILLCAAAAASPTVAIDRALQAGSEIASIRTDVLK